MGTLEQQTEKYNEAVAFIKNIEASDGPYKLSVGDKRQFDALFNHATHGAFRHAAPDATKGLGTREKQQWEGLANIPKTEAMRRYVDKTDKIKIDYNLALNAAQHS